MSNYTKLSAIFWSGANEKGRTSIVTIGSCTDSGPNPAINGSSGASITQGYLRRLVDHLEGYRFSGVFLSPRYVTRCLCPSDRAPKDGSANTVCANGSSMVSLDLLR